MNEECGPAEYADFSRRLVDALARDARVVGLAALRSMSGEPPAPDEHSDHGFFVITRGDEQENLRAQLSWWPRMRSSRTSKVSPAGALI